MSEKEYVALFLGFLRQSLQTEFQPSVDLKMYLNGWTTETFYFNYSDSGRNLHTRGSCTCEYFLEKQLHVLNILGVRRFYLTHTQVFTTTFIVTCSLL